MLFILPYFTGNGEDGMKLAVSRDGLTFEAVNEGKAVFQSSIGTGLVRDPSIVLGPDGVFHAVWTTGWWDKDRIGVAHSKDLLTWSKPEVVPVMGKFPNNLNCWAPEIHWDAEAKLYLIVWSSTVRGMFPETDGASENGPDQKPLNHRMFAATTTDFKTYSPSRLFYDNGFSVIDGMIASTKTDRGWAMVLKDETRFPTAQKNLRLAFAEKMDGPYRAAEAPFTPAGLWCEGPTLLKFGGEWRVYFDRYTENRWGLLTSPDLKTWTDRSSTLRIPSGARHGTPFVVDASRLPWLK